MPFIWVSMYLARKLCTNWKHCFYVSLYWRGDCHFSWSSEPREGLATCSAKREPSFVRYFKTLSIGPVPGFEPATSLSAVTRHVILGSLSNHDDNHNDDFKKKNNRFNDQNNSSARASCFLVHFFDVHCTTTTGNPLIWLFMEDVDILRRISLHLF